MKNLRPVILLSVLRKILAIIVVGRTFDHLRKVISISQAAYSPGRSTTELVFTFKILAEIAICAQDFTLYLLMLDMSRAFDTIDRGILLKDLSEILESDELHLVSLLLKDVRLQVKYNGVTGNIFTSDIGSPQGDCAGPIWFIFYLHKAILAAKINLETSRNILLDIKHDHTYVNKDSFKSDIEKDYSYSKNITSKGNCGFLIEQQYADDASWATIIKLSKNLWKVMLHQNWKGNILLTKIRLRITVYKELEINHGKMQISWVFIRK